MEASPIWGSYGIWISPIVFNTQRSSLKVLEKSKASASIKLKILELVIYNQVIYDTKFAMWPLKMYEKLDDIITTSIKIITKNMNSKKKKKILNHSKETISN